MKRALLYPLTLGLLLAGPLAGQTLQTRNQLGEMTLQKGSSGWKVDQGQEATALPVPATVYFSTLRPFGSGFVAAGVDYGPLSGGGRGYSLVLVRGAGKTFEVLPTPAIAPGEVAMAATPIVGPAGLDALLWIEGKNEQAGAVKAAWWNGSAFSPTSILSPAGAGTQTALQALRLADGSWLAVWSAFDGEDDEILWSRGTPQGWSPPQALSNNDVPDITPALRQVAGGALVVWSFYDHNDYRLRAASFADNSWKAGATFGGKGAALPTFADTAGATITFRQVYPESWRVVELDAAGQVKREVGLPTATRRAPNVLAADDHAVTIEWSSTDATKTPVSIVVPWEEKKN